MRDPERIRRLCNIIADIWEKNCPDWRFGQLINNVLYANNIESFYLEDEQFVELLMDYFNENKSQ